MSEFDVEMFEDTALEDEDSTSDKKSKEAKASTNVKSNDSAPKTYELPWLVLCRGDRLSRQTVDSSVGHSPTNQLAVSQVADWITHPLVNSPKCLIKICST